MSDIESAEDELADILSENAQLFPRDDNLSANDNDFLSGVKYKGFFELDAEASTRRSWNGRSMAKLLVTVLVLLLVLLVVDIAQFYFTPTTFKIVQTDVLVLSNPLRTSLVVDVTAASSILPLGAKQSSCTLEYLTTVMTSVDRTATSDLRLPLGKIKISDMSNPSALHWFRPRTTTHRVNVTLHDFNIDNAKSFVQFEVLPASKCSSRICCLLLNISALFFGVDNSYCCLESLNIFIFWITFLDVLTLAIKI